MFLCVHTHVCAGQRASLGGTSHFVLLSQALSLAWRLPIRIDWMVRGPLGSTCPHLSRKGNSKYTPICFLSVGARINVNPHTCMADTLSTKLSPQPQIKASEAPAAIVFRKGQI